MIFPVFYGFVMAYPMWTFHSKLLNRKLNTPFGLLNHLALDLITRGYIYIYIIQYSSYIPLKSIKSEYIPLYPIDISQVYPIRSSTTLRRWSCHLGDPNLGLKATLSASAKVNIYVLDMWMKNEITQNNHEISYIIHIYICYVHILHACKFLLHRVLNVAEAGI